MRRQINIEHGKYFPAIDGLRAISFIIVFLFHCDIRLMDIGWSGVIVFFVISGFLITDILMNQSRSNYFTIFFTKRLLRITPIAVLVLVGCSIVFYVVNHKIPNNWMFYLFNIQNFLWVFNTTLADLNGYLAHTWTLAIEEQFYLVWPFIIFFFPPKKIGWVCLGIILSVFLYRALATMVFNNPLATSIMLISQADSLSLGCLLAFLRKEHSDSRAVKIGISLSIPVGAIGLLSVIFYLSQYYDIPFESAYSLLRSSDKYLINGFTSQIYFFIALIAFGTIHLIITKPQSLLSRILGSRIFVHLGLISYGLYIYHWPILVFIKHFTSDSLLISIIGGVATYLVSMLSYVTIERFFRSNKARFTNGMVFIKNSMFSHKKESK